MALSRLLPTGLKAQLSTALPESLNKDSLCLVLLWSSHNNYSHTLFPRAVRLYLTPDLCSSKTVAQRLSGGGVEVCIGTLTFRVYRPDMPRASQGPAPEPNMIFGVGETVRPPGWASTSPIFAHQTPHSPTPPSPWGAETSPLP